MSSNLIKYGYNYIPVETKRVIDNNVLLEKRLEDSFDSSTNQSFTKDGFVGGIEAPEIEIIPEIEEGKEDVIVDCGPTPEEMIAAANAEIVQMRQQAKKDIEEEKLRAIEIAKKQGYEEGVEKSNIEYNKKLQQLQNKEQELECSYNEQIEQLEPHLIELFNGIYEHIFTVDLAESQKVICHLIKTAFTKIDGGNHYIVHIAEADYQTVIQNKDSLVNKNNSAVLVEFVEDTLLHQNECMIETENGIFDCGLGTQLEELRKKIKLLSFDK